MKYLITGASGFIGTHVLYALLKSANEKNLVDVVSIDKRSAEYDGLIKEEGDYNIVKGGRWWNILYASSEYNSSPEIVADISDYSNNLEILKALEGVDTVFHLAALPSVPESIENPLRFNEANVKGTLNMLELSKEAGVRRFVFSSSSSVYGDTEVFPTTETSPLNPLSPYAVQKQIGELYCRLYSQIYNLETVCLRYFNVYGEGMPTQGAYCNVMGAFSAAKKEGKPLKIFGDGSYRRDFTYVKDVAEANILAATSAKVGKGECINIGTQTNYSIQEIADVFGGVVEYLPKRLEASLSLADNTRAKELLNWAPTTHVKDWLNENIYRGT
jgi:UDP-glucose 4-epimerase